VTLTAIATRYRGQIGAYEIWNEENLAGEDGGDIDVSAYYRTLEASFKAIKAADPTALVLLGVLSSKVWLAGLLEKEGGVAGQARAGVPVTARQVAKRSALVSR